MSPTPFQNPVSRRKLLLGGLAAGGSFALSGCIGGSPSPTTASSSAAGDASLPLTLQSDLSDPLPKAAMESLVKGYTKTKLTMNTVATEQFRAQLSTYLTSANPPDVLTWLGPWPATTPARGCCSTCRTCGPATGPARTSRRR
jgi:multiple sugar transport system substrate-binding protein